MKKFEKSYKGFDIVYFEVDDTDKMYFKGDYIIGFYYMWDVRYIFVKHVNLNFYSI